MTLLTEEPRIQTEPRNGLGMLPVQLLLAVVVCIGYGILATHRGWETALRSNIPPLYGWWKRPVFLGHPFKIAFLFPPLVLFAGWWRFSRRQRERPLPDAMFVVLAVLFIFCFNIAVCMMDGGPTAGERAITYWRPFYEIVRPFDYPHIEFTTDVHFVQSTRQFLQDYVSLHPGLSLHSCTHPPGPVLFLAYIHWIFGYGLMPMALVAIAVSALSAVPAFLAARRLYGRRVAALALGLLAVVPSVVLYGATSMDGVYMLPLLTAFYLFIAATQVKSRRLAAVLSAALGATLVIASLMTFSASCLGILFGVYAGIAWLRRGNDRAGQWQRVWAILAVAGATFLAGYLVIYQSTGYNVVACLKISMHSDSSLMGDRARSLPRYLDVSVANLGAFLIGSGLLVTLLFAREVIVAIRQMVLGRPFDAMLVAFAITLVGLSFSTLFRWETERIWVFMMPLAVFAAARYIAGEERSGSESAQNAFNFSIVALFAQTVAMQVFTFLLW